ncbi:hypothetical protein EV385_6295 [Krasilnikovia cinnamomea]|uniref:Uncharacterized protein n=1 Tax=Krasilnikovia cinnamomea TaxID=349313 RepID=A0A4Q7ZTS6_9ACTN|nr:hypothetical protein [Krasilnikovia cinnamomea]RZU54344.1 hypothetical protein EV385_6295 [Krasilnikovia cinnamomea]
MDKSAPTGTRVVGQAEDAGQVAADEGPRIIAAPPKPRRIVVWLGGTLAVALLAGSAVVLAALTRDPDTDPPPISVGPGQTRAAPTTLAAPGRTPSSAPTRARAARLELAGATTSIRVRVADTGRDLVRVSGGRARADRAGTVVRVTPAQGAPAVEITLDLDVRWTVRTTAGVTEARLDLGAARLAAVDLAGGAARVELTLPRPGGTVPVRVGAGVNELRLHAPAGCPLRIRAGGGANRVVIDGRVRDGVPRGGSVATADFAGATDRLDVDAVAGLGTVTVDRTA